MGEAELWSVGVGTLGTQSKSERIKTDSKGQEDDKSVFRGRRVHCFPPVVLTNLFSLMDRSKGITPCHISQ